MKGAARRVTLDHLVEVLEAGLAAKVAAIKALYPADSLPDIKTVYVNEEDYNKVVDTPCLLIFPHGPEVLSAMTGAYLYEFPIDICAFDVPKADGLPALYNRLYAYQGALTDLLLSDYPYQAGYWDEIRALEPVDPQNLADQRFGEMGRVEGYRYGFQIALSYP
jgi:hypothetical protein